MEGKNEAVADHMKVDLNMHSIVPEGVHEKLGLRLRLQCEYAQPVEGQPTDSCPELSVFMFSAYLRSLMNYAAVSAEYFELYPFKDNFETAKVKLFDTDLGQEEVKRVKKMEYAKDMNDALIMMTGLRMKERRVAEKKK